MLINIIKQFNWVDIFVVIVVFRICYISLKNGLAKDFFKLLGTLTAIYISLHYYIVICDLLRKYMPVEKIPLEFLDFLVFTVLAILGYLVFVLLRSIFDCFIKMEAVPRLNKWGGLVSGILRSFLLAGLIIFMLAISSIGYLKKSTEDSYFGKRFFNIAPNTYSWLWNAVASKFMTAEKFNNKVTELQQGFAKK